MSKPLIFSHLISQLRDTFSAFPDNRLSSNHTLYSMKDASICTFSVFFLQCSSFLLLVFVHGQCQQLLIILINLLLNFSELALIVLNVTAVFIGNAMPA